MSGKKFNLKHIFTAATILTGTILILALAGCFSPWKGDEGYLTISLGSGTSRAGWNIDDENQNYDQEIILDGPGGRISQKIAKGVTAASIKLIPGDWNVMVRATGARPEAESELQPGADSYESLGFPAVMLKALGYGTVKIEAGKTSPVKISMAAATEVFNWDQLNYAFRQASASEEYILIADNIKTESSLSFYVETGDTKKLTLVADKDVKITRDISDPQNSDGHMFSINGNAEFDLGIKGMRGQITIDGGGVEVYSSIIRTDPDVVLVINDGIILTNNNNINADDQGGAISAYGDVIINGGKIINNTSINGGGINFSGKSCTMNGGIISQNNASDCGGGVYLTGYYTSLSGDATTFTMKGSAAISGNTGNNGGGVYVASSGTFIMSDNSAVSGNGAPYSGGGVYVENGIFSMLDNSIISGNKILTGVVVDGEEVIGGEGGGIYLGYYANLQITGGTIYGIKAGGSLPNDPTSLTVTEDFIGTATCGKFAENDTLPDYIYSDLTQLLMDRSTNATIRAIDGKLIEPQLFSIPD
ncbi:MAG: hypothetical protein FWD78_00865 [Treponema sp.]|nr:hypothetical protein [Treponema sp.]